MTTETKAAPAARPAFGTVLSPSMAVATFRGGAWGRHELRPTGPIELHPAAHVLHYSSSCFEGFKAYRWADGSIHVFRMDRHIERLRQSARSLMLPEPDDCFVALPRERERGAVDGLPRYLCRGEGMPVCCF